MEPVEHAFLDVERARTLIGLGRFDEAVSSLGQLLGRGPENAEGWCLLAQAHLGREDPNAALEAADHAVAFAPERSWAHRLRSIALAALGKHDEAIAAALEAVKFGPDDWQAYAWLAGLFVQDKKRRAEALPAAEYAVALGPGESRAQLVLGIALAANGKRREADEALRRALEIDPQNSDAHHALARLKLRRGSFGRAGTLADAAGGFQAAVQTDPRAVESGRNLELVLRVFLARLSYFILIGGYIYVRIPASSQSGNTTASLLILGTLCVPAIYAWRFVSLLSPDLRQHLRYTLTHGRIALVSAIQLFAVLLLLYTAVAAPSNHTTAAAAFCLTLVARLLLVNEIYKVTGRRLISTSSLWLIAAGFALIAVLFGFGATESGFGTGGAVLASVSGAFCVAMLYMIRRRRA